MFTTTDLRDRGNFYVPCVAKYEMHAERSIVIDTEDDFSRAETVAEAVLGPICLDSVKRLEEM